MRSLFFKELNSFFNGLTAYVVLGVFLLVSGLFLWVFPGSFHIPESTHANLDGLFSLAPYLFLFLVPAITMRFFAEESKSGTLEMLMTKPVSELGIILAKFAAAAALLVFSLLPTLVYFVTVSVYALPPGVDSGGIWGSYLGLLLLGISFTAIGLFASSLTDNQVFSFVIAFFLSGFFFIGFELLYTLELFGGMELLIRKMGMHYHYTSLGRGVIDTRDLLYFFGLVFLFLMFTGLNLESRRRKQVWKQRAWQVLVALLILSAVQVFASGRFARFDLTSDRRYTLTDATRKLLAELDEAVYFRVYLEGDFPPAFRHFRNQVKDMLDEFRAYSGWIEYEFVNPARAAEAEGVQRYYDMLVGKGLRPAQIQTRAGDASSVRLIFPGALVHAGSQEKALHLLQDGMGGQTEDMLHRSALALEYQLALGIRQVTAERRERIAFVESHGTWEKRYVADAVQRLGERYQLDWIHLDQGLADLLKYRTLVFANPTEVFSEACKLTIDQYLMHGGSMLWLVDPVFADMDSLMVAPETLGVAKNLNLDDLFFRYGLRLNPELLQDLHAAPLPVTTGHIGSRPQISLLPWVFFPLVGSASGHPVVAHLDWIRTEFISSIDTIHNERLVKTPLLQTSPYTRTLPVPARISLDILRHPPDEAAFRGPARMVAVLLEGKFESLFTQRVLPGISWPENMEPRFLSEETAMIVVSDGDLIRNQFDQNGRPLPLGFDRHSGDTYGNADFILNAVDHLSGASDLIQARSRDIRMRLLDGSRLQADRMLVQLLNTMLPPGLVLLFGLTRMGLRRAAYGRKKARR